MSETDRSAIPVSLEVRPSLPIVQLTVFGGASMDATASTLSDRLGLTGAHSPTRAARSSRLHSYRLAPARWLLSDSAGDEPGLLGRLRDLLAGDVALLPFGSGRTILRLQGHCARDVLAKGCSIDLHPRSFGPDDFAQTLVAHVPGLIHRVGEADLFDVYVPRSYGLSTWEWLIDAAREYAPAAGSDSS